MTNNRHSGTVANDLFEITDENDCDTQKVLQPNYDPYFTCNKKVVEDLLRDEIRYENKAGFCNHEGPTALNLWMRETLITWLRDVADHKKCESEVLSLAVMLVDRYLSICCVPKQDYQLIGATCFLIASKIKETIPVAVEKMVLYTDSCVTSQDLLTTEIKLSLALDFDMNAVTPVDYILPTLDLVCYDKSMKDPLHQTSISIYMKCIHMVTLCNYQPSCVSGACIVAACQSLYTNDHNLLIESFNSVVNILGTDRPVLLDCFKIIQEGMHSKPSSHPDESDVHSKLSPDKEKIKSKQTPTDLRDVRF